MDFNILDEFKSNKKRFIFIVSIIIGVVILIVFIGDFLKNSNDKRKLELALKNIGEHIYQESYYPAIKENISDFSDKGLKLDLYELFEAIKMNSNDYFYNKKTRELCDINNTYVIIYPKQPYGKKDYKINTVLACGY